MVSHNLQDVHPSSKIKITQNEVYYGLEIWHQDLTHKIKTRWSAIDGQPPSLEWSPTIQNLPEGRVLQT